MNCCQIVAEKTRKSRPLKSSIWREKKQVSKYHVCWARFDFRGLLRVFQRLGRQGSHYELAFNGHFTDRHGKKKSAVLSENFEGGRVFRRNAVCNQGFLVEKWEINPIENWKSNLRRGASPQSRLRIQFEIGFISNLRQQKHRFMYETHGLKHFWILKKYFWSAKNQGVIHKPGGNYFLSPG